MPRLAGKVAFITGAGTGIGRAAAVLFAGEGAKVVVAEIDARTGDETAHLAGNGAIAIQTDVTEPDSLEQAIRRDGRPFRRAARLAQQRRRLDRGRQHRRRGAARRVLAGH